MVVMAAAGCRSAAEEADMADLGVIPLGVDRATVMVCRGAISVAKGTPINVLVRSDYYGGGSSSRMGGFSDSGSGRRQYEEYDAGGDEVPSRSSSTVNRSSSLRSQPARKSSAPPPAPVPNLLDFDDDVPPAPAPAPAAEVMTVPGLATNKALPKPVNLDGKLTP